MKKISKENTIPTNIRIERFLSKISVNLKSECWEWRGAKSTFGYGLLMRNTVTLRAHRVSYSIFVGPLVEDLVIDHICRNKICVNPDHLRQVTPKLNDLENSGSLGFVNSQKTHCPKGHIYNSRNTYMYRNMRTCRACAAIKSSNAMLKLKPFRASNE